MGNVTSGLRMAGGRGHRRFTSFSANSGRTGTGELESRWWIEGGLEVGRGGGEIGKRK
jgi:hypothetical protein